MASRIQIRRGFSFNWEAVNPILSQGEMGYELDTGKLKIGDGATAWNPLPYFGGANGNGFSGKYEDLVGVPTLLSGFNNDVGFITADSLPSDISQLSDTAGLLQSKTGLLTFRDATIVGAGSGPGRAPTVEIAPAAGFLDRTAIFDVEFNNVRLFANSLSSTTLQVGERNNIIQVSETAGLSLAHTSSKPESVEFIDLIDFTSAVWEADSSGGSIVFDTTNNELVSKGYSIMPDAMSTVDITTAAGDIKLTFIGFTRTDLTTYRLLVAEGPANPTAVSKIVLTSAIPTNNSISLANNNINTIADGRVSITSNSEVNIENTSKDGSVLISTNTLDVSSRTWKFNPDGGIIFPDSTVQTSAWTGQTNWGSITDAPAVPASLVDLGIIDGTAGQMLVTNGDGTFKFVDPAGLTAAFNMHELNDVDITTPSTGQVLAFNGSKWTNTDAVTINTFSINELPASAASLTYDNTTGTFNFTPPDLSAFLTSSDASLAYQPLNDSLNTIAGFSPVDAGLLKKTNTGWELSNETDPVFSASPAATVTSSQISNWETAYSWGDHSSAGYLKPLSIDTVAGVTDVLAPTETASLNLVCGQAYILYKITTSASAWVRVYDSTSSRANDASRSQGVDPGVSSGVIAEAITTGAETIVFAPAPNGFNNDMPVSNIMPIAVTNLSGTTAAITVTITKLTLVN